jgi:3-hydroxyacyl-[acyl-carrier-protein] dehydratase
LHSHEKPETRDQKPETQKRMSSDPIALGLPHREPFIFVDTVEALVPGESAVCRKTFRGDEPFFQGHFPGNAIVPGVLLTEGLAQTAGIAVGGPEKTFFLTAIRTMKFMRPVKPGEVIRLAARKVASAGGLIQCMVEARVDKEVVAEGQIVLATVQPAQS